ncbi:MAG: hypothetical protein F4Y45_01240 [Acidobacteria bacterium]|nr:hypothetical protein [Acidobacteriota bacterium]MYD72505.1 hypothetical protein [Acidobacteriota bacterium]MYJ05017.1 hypothetical protein [Acidobacteriota bacterium]
MTDSAVQAAIDAAIRAHLERRGNAPPVAGGPAGPRSSHPGEDASHARFGGSRLAGDPPSGQCVIEPSVECVHCDYCRSQGY